MYKVGECECVNTEEGTDFAIGNIWEMYVAQTVEGITNLIKVKYCFSCDVQGWVAERSREFKRYFSYLFGTSFNKGSADITDPCSLIASSRKFPFFS